MRFHFIKITFFLMFVTNLFAAVVEHDIHIEFSYDYQPIGAGTTLSHYSLYVSGTLVDTIDVSELTATSSDSFAADAVFSYECGQENSFTLTATDSNGVVSPHSPPYLFFLGCVSAPKDFKLEFSSKGIKLKILGQESSEDRML